MKKKQKTYILLVIVIIVWSVVGIQFFRYSHQYEEEIPEINYQKFQPNITAKKETYKVSIHERDPFLGTLHNSAKNKTKKKKKTTQKVPVVFPNIQYKGMISSNDNTSFIITINGKQYIMRTRVKKDDVELISGTKKEIKVLYKGKYKTIKK
ncbi:hypothetical protein [Tenacibaculum jejuense]|uniref:Uncharacterized protein n=1 Tax=Tenacibaculum jejuense TaxID=584609 RepID=A0A238UA61_9FLAO|nr:hypothetical protein [Tenacibaculum jejuense]SNR15448.1 conserved protein of unknown function [Tenacibaculum jejuense]